MVRDHSRFGGAVTVLAALVVLCSAGGVYGVQYLFDRGHGMIYNSWQDVTWLQDSKYIKTLGLDSDGLVTSAVAQSFAENLVVAGIDYWRLPYDSTYSGGDLYMLYGTFNSQWDPPYSKGPFLNIDWNTRYWVQGGGMYDGKWFAYDFGTGPVPSGVHPAYPGDLLGVWPCHPGDVWVDSNIDHQMDNGGFSTGYEGWSVVGAGHVDISNYPGTANAVARMTTGSAVDLLQLTDTPASAFRVRFDCGFAQDGGLLSVYLNGVRLGELNGVQGPLTPRWFQIDDAAMQGLGAAELKFRMDGPTSGLIGYVDNVSLELVPEPAALSLLAMGGLVMALRRRSLPWRR